MADEDPPGGDLEPAKPATPDTPPPDFAPTDYTDGRVPLDWRSKYPPEARKQIRFEATYLATLLLSLPATIIVLLSGMGCAWSDEGCKYLFALLGGALGGSLFATKWLYHSVAKRIWHVDRRLWRLFTPVLSAGLAFGTTLLIKADVISIFSQQALDSPQAILAISFLVGYFSDNATAKLTEVAETVFGATRERHQPPNGDNGTSAGSGSAPPSTGR